MEADFTLEFRGGDLSNGKERYRSLTDCSKKRYIPKRLMLAASKEKPPGIRNGDIFWNEFQPWLVMNLERLQQAVEDDAPKESLKEQKLVEEIKALRNKNKRLDKGYISRKLVIQTFTYVSKKVSEIINGKFEYELPPKLSGLGEVEIKERLMKVRDEILKQFKTPLNEWEGFSDLPEDDEQDNDTTV